MAFLTRLSALVSKQIPTPASNPPSGANVLYPKSDGAWYTLGSDGIERRVGGGVVPQPNVQIFSTAGAFTWTKPAGAKTVVIECLGGGAGGGSAGAAASGAHAKGGGGGAGAYATATVDASTLASTVAVTVGAAGAGSTNAANPGSNGGSSSFGSIAVASGGIGGNSGSSSTATFAVQGGLGGTATAGDVQAPGNPGGYGFGGASLGIGGTGAATEYGAGGRGGWSNAAGNGVQGYDASGYGAGGGGALATSTGSGGAGGSGSGGLVIVTTYFDTDTSSTGTVATDTANLVTNPSFEILNTDGTINSWSNYWAINTPVHSVETTLANVYNGTKAAKVVLDQDDTGRYGSNTFAVAEGEIITIRARVKTTSTAGLEAAFMLFTSGPTDPDPGFFASGSTTQTFTWVQVANDGYFLAEATFTIPAGDTKGHLEVQLANPASRAAGTVTAWLDSVMVLPEMNPTGKAAIVRDPPGVIKEYAGFTPPTGYLLCDGSSYNRADYPYLWDALTYKLTASGTSGASTITTSAIGPAVMGMEITGPGVPPGTTITGITQTTGYTIGISNALTATSTNAEFRLAPHGVAAATTFKVPDRRGRVGVGVDGTPEFNNLGIKGGDRNMQQHNHSASASTGGESGHTHVANLRYGTNTTTGGTATRISAIMEVPGSNANAIVNWNTSSSSGHSHSTSVTVNNNGTGTAGNLQPYLGLTYIIKT